MPATPIAEAMSTAASNKPRGVPVKVAAGAAVAVLALVIGLFAWGSSNRSSAEKWRDRGRLDHSRLAAQVAAVKASQATVADARSKVADLAAKNANLTDRESVLQDVLKGAPKLDAAIAKCTAAADAIKPTDKASVDAAVTACEAAEAEAASLQQVVESLGL